jgi:glyoxylase-like metal-dependent hydrolase (beta-lactamase superfamily II)
MSGRGTQLIPVLVRLAAIGVVVAIAVAVWLRFTNPSSSIATTEFEVLAAAVGKVAPGVYLLGESSPSATYIVETTDGLVLIDSGMEADAATVTAQLVQLHLDWRKLRAILLTHVHGDHSLGAARLRAETGAKIYAGRGDAKPLREGGPREAFFSTFAAAGVDPHPTVVDVALEGEERLTFGGTRITAIAAPGHTPGSICYLAEQSGRRILFTGDVVQCLKPEAKGAFGTYTAYLAPRYRGDAERYLETLRRLRALPAPDLVLPGHPRMDAPAQNPRVTPEQWRDLLDKGIAELDVLLKRYRTDGANFLDGDAKELLPGLHYLGDFEHAAEYCLVTTGGLYLFDAPGGPGFVEWMRGRFKALGWEGRALAAVLLTSADEKATAGLPALVQNTHCAVIAPDAGMETVRALCPDGTKIISAGELATLHWFDARVMPLRGRGVAPQAFVIKLPGKTVLVSGRIPVKISQQTALPLMREFFGPGDRAAEYLKALETLATVKPDLWLPAVPVHGQNANLYDRDWEDVLAENRQMLR